MGKKDSSNDHEAATFPPKLQAPSSGSPKQESFPYHNENNFFSAHYDDNTAQHDYNNQYNYNYDYGQNNEGYSGHHANDGADEQAINDIADFLKEDGF